MAILTFLEKKVFEDFIGTHGAGYVLDFNDSGFRDFIGEITSLDINDGKYHENGSSKAKRLRTFIKLESDYTVGSVFRKLYEYKKTIGNYDAAAMQDFYNISERLLSGSVVEHLDAIAANNNDKDFNQLAKLIKDAIENNEPEAALDRLHTFMFKFLKELCDTHGVVYTKEESVNAIYGKYIKAIRDKGFIESDMAEKIIQSTFQVIQAFNDIRNNKSFAHDNPVLNYDESVLIFGYVTNTVKFITALETKNKNVAIAAAKPDWGTEF